MFHGLGNQIGAEAIDRLTLLANHLLASEPVASRRLAAHAGRTLAVRLDGWPAPLPAPTIPWLRVTPAGLVERVEGGAPPDGEPDLRVAIDASNPALAAAQALVGTRPKIDVSGDAAFAADLNWLFDNLRWDAEDDLARFVGPIPAREIARIGGGIAAALRQVARTVGDLAARR